jgi:DNA-binding GntR family transcriptional regulator
MPPRLVDETVMTELAPQKLSDSSGFERPNLLPERLAAYIRQQIISGEFPPGQRLVEQELVRLTNVSRVPLREALRILAIEGLITLSPHKGASVNELSEAELDELFGARSALEQFAARKIAVDGPEEAVTILRRLVASMREAVEQCNWPAYNRDALQFHEELMRSSGNTLVVNLYNQVRTRFSRYQSILGHTPRSASQSVEEHAKMVRAIAKGNPDLAATETEKHIKNLVKRFHLASRRPVSKD